MSGVVSTYSVDNMLDIVVEFPLPSISTSIQNKKLLVVSI